MTRIGQNERLKRRQHKLLETLEAIVEVLTFKRIALIAVLTVIGVGLWTVYDNREVVVHKLAGTEECAK